jgi:endonuclease YncB( thermonuclease family)
MGFIRSWQFAAGFSSAIGIMTGTVVIGSAIADKQGPTVFRGASFACIPAQIWDGDTFTCSDGRKIRVAGIAAREVRVRKASSRTEEGRRFIVEDGGCREGHPCPSISGAASREALAAMLGAKPSGLEELGPHGHILINGPALQCEPNGTSGDRQAAWCTSPVAGDISCAMIRGGYALRWERYWKGRHC